MKVILLVEMKNLGVPGQVVKVADGYARNYLVPRGLVVEATEGNLKKWEERGRDLQLREKHEQEQAQQILQKMENFTLKFSRPVGEEDKIFGSVTAQDLAEALHQEGIDIDKHNIELTEPLKSLGEFLIPVRLSRGVAANLKIMVTGEASPKKGKGKIPKKGEGKTSQKEKPKKTSSRVSSRREKKSPLEEKS